MIKKTKDGEKEEIIWDLEPDIIKVREAERRKTIITKLYNYIALIIVFCFVITHFLFLIGINPSLSPFTEVLRTLTIMVVGFYFGKKVQD